MNRGPIGSASVRRMIVVFTIRELESRPFSCDARPVIIIRVILKEIVGKPLTTDYTFRSRIPQQGNHFANSGDLEVVSKSVVVALRFSTMTSH